VLAVADGEGRNAVYLAELGHEVIMWDYTESGLVKCQQLAAERGVQVETKRVDVTQPVWEQEAYDAIICTFLHLLAPERQYVLSQMAASLKPGGSLIMEVYSKEQIHYKTGGPGEVERLYSPLDFYHAFSDWDIKHLFVGEVERQEGTLHNGLSHVVQCFVKKP
jgi:protein-L-isoaspartate O-methyltransferase